MSNEQLIEVMLIIKKKGVDLSTLKQSYTVYFYNCLRKHKLINKRLTEDEFEMLKKFISK